jgi:hypothetical protein
MRNDRTFECSTWYGAYILGRHAAWLRRPPSLQGVVTRTRDARRSLDHLGLGSRAWAERSGEIPRSRRGGLLAPLVASDRHSRFGANETAARVMRRASGLHMREMDGASAVSQGTTVRPGTWSAT